jgi:effector-binding domain-containing protein
MKSSGPYSFVAAVVFILIGSSCSNEPEPEKKETLKPAPEVKITDSTVFANNISGFSNDIGPLGVYDVPEMLVLSYMDSAALKDISSKMIKNYALLEKEMQEVGAEMNGPIGTIIYNNSVKNYKFESVLPIRKMPVRQPKHCAIVVLEASHMLVFNFYGSYQNLFAAYDKIKKYCDKNDLIQTGPMREFYITDPAKEKDPQKWLTRIMLPVIAMDKKTIKKRR